MRVATAEPFEPDVGGRAALPDRLTAATGPAKDGLAMGGRNERGLGLIEILVVLVIVGVIGGVVLRQYMSSTARTVEQFQQQKPISYGKVTADQMTLATVRTALDLYRAQHEQWPADKAAVLALLAGPPRFQCPGNDFEYDAGTGSIRLLIQDPARC